MACYCLELTFKFLLGDRNEEQLLVGWAIPQLHSIDALLKMLDPSLDEECHAKSLSHFADIISRCVRSGEFFLTLV